jgi:hypothetical protein
VVELPQVGPTIESSLWQIRDSSYDFSAMFLWQSVKPRQLLAVLYYCKIHPRMTGKVVVK